MGKKEDLNLYNLIMKGDILIFPTDNKKHVLGQIKRILRVNKAINIMKGDELCQENIFIDIQKLDVLDKETHFQVETFCSSSEPQRVSGKDCFVMQPVMCVLGFQYYLYFWKIFDLFSKTFSAFVTF